jgi:hypothetical protein
MDTPDRGMRDAVGQREGGLWTRREVVSAIGAGVVSAAWPRDELSATADTISIRFQGAILITRDTRYKYVDILMPKGERTIARHPNGPLAIRHTPRMAFYRAVMQSNGKVKYIYQRAPDLSQKSLEIHGEPAQDSGPLFQDSSLIQMEKILPHYSEIRPSGDDLSPVYASRVRVFGGRFYADPVPSHSFTIRTFNSDTPLPEFPGSGGIIWQAGKDDVHVKASDGDIRIPRILQASIHSEVIIGYLPFDMPAQHWHSPGHPVTKGYIDSDFMWLYQALVPPGMLQNPNPWPDYLGSDPLPAPICTKPDPPVPGRAYPATASSPTCFGGCFGC